jgi:phospholipid-binding lipoprotein MlaA
VLGPSNLRDAVGTAVDVAFNPMTWVGGAPVTIAQAGSTGTKVVDVRSRHLQDLDDLEKNSLDYYAALRSVYRQHREAEIRDTLGPGAVAARPAAPEDAP